MGQVVDICKQHGTIVGHPHATAKNMQELMVQGYQFLMAAPARTYTDLEKGLELSGRN
jgi:4-hydroxy-2-oxoheptanedioate aldolase